MPRKDNLYPLLREVFAARKKFLIWDENKNPLPDSLGTMKKSIFAVQSVYEEAIHSLYQLSLVCQDVAKCKTMARKCPWDPKYISRSDHLRFIAMLLLHLVYLFEERMKGAILWCNRMPTLKEKIDGTKALREVKKQLGPRIRERGQHVHEGTYPAGHTAYLQAIAHLQAIEVMQEAGSFAEGYTVKKYGTRAMRNHICKEITSELTKMEGIAGEFYKEHAPTLVVNMKEFHDFAQHLIRKATEKAT